MSWRVEVKPSAEKQYLRLDRTTRRRIKDTLHDLENADSDERGHRFRRMRTLWCEGLIESPGW